MNLLDVVEYLGNKMYWFQVLMYWAAARAMTTASGVMICTRAFITLAADAIYSATRDMFNATDAIRTAENRLGVEDIEQAQPMAEDECVQFIVLRLITFNIRYAAAASTYEQPWSVRGPLIID
jgi:hypothetical protein